MSAPGFFDRAILKAAFGILLGIILLAGPTAASRQMQDHAAGQPETRVEEVTDVLHGKEIVDPYRWLEDQWSAETRAWIDAQNRYARSLLDRVAGRAALRERLSRQMRVDHVDTPIVAGGRCFYQRRGAEQKLSVVCVRDDPWGKERVLIDPHGWSEGQTISAAMRGVTPDGKILIYGTRKGGEDETAVNFLDVDSGVDLPFSLPRARYGGVSLTAGRKGIYFARRDPEGMRLYYRAADAAPGSEAAVFGEGIPQHMFVGCRVTDDERYLIVSVSEGWTRNELYIKDLQQDGPIAPLIKGIDALFNFRYAGGRLFVGTDWQAPNYRVLLIDLADPRQGAWREIVPESSAVLQGVTLAGGKLVLRYLDNVKSRLEILDAQGGKLDSISFPGIGAVGDVSGDWRSGDLFFSFSSFNVPENVYHYGMTEGEMKEWAASSIPFEGDRYEVRQVWYSSRDGARIPMFIAAPKGLELDGANPTLLTGYGGFNISRTPGFSPLAAAWLEMGGVYAVPNLRGGGEFGEDWHRAGMLEHKQNVFDDFHAAAEFLVREGYSRPDKLAVMGGSNGGLLVGAALTQRPELLGAVICTYPLLDMVRYHKFLVGSTWVPEYGSADDPRQFKFISEYSPYHHVRKGGMYPAVLFVTGDSDTRVAPLHARKMTALLQASTGSGKPVMLLYDTEAGHSGGRPIDAQIEDNVDRLAFLARQLGVELE